MSAAEPDIEALQTGRQYVIYDAEQSTAWLQSDTVVDLEGQQ